MVDHVSPAVRSRIMASVKSYGTKPETAVRRALHRLGYRFRLHRRDLPGKPDLAFVAKRKVIFINGCFWHLHKGCPRANIPKSNVEYWAMKLERNRLRDAENIAYLRNLGWDAYTLWECELRDPDKAVHRVCLFLGPPGSCQVER